MRDFLMRHGLWAVRALCTLEFAFGLLLLRAYLKKKRVILLLMACMSFGLFYDALVLSVGNHLGHSALHGFSRLRFVFHGMLLPLMLPICAEALDLPKPAKRAVGVLTAVLMAAGAVCGFRTDLEETEIAGIMRCFSSEATPAFAEKFLMMLSSGGAAALLLSGLAVWIRKKNPLLFIGALLMFVFEALGPATGNTDLIFLIGMFGECSLALFYYLYSGTVDPDPLQGE